MLAVLLARANGSSRLSGLQTLKYKESDRYTQTLKLLSFLGRRAETDGSDLIIHGSSRSFNGHGDFDPAGDHRMAMAAQVANCGGARLHIATSDVVNKAFLEFWDAIGVKAQ